MKKNKYKNALIVIGIFVGVVALILLIMTVLAVCMVKGAENINDITDVNDKTIIEKDTGEVIKEGVSSGDINDENNDDSVTESDDTDASLPQAEGDKTYALNCSLEESGSYISHACGGIDNIDYTNSLEAFEYNYNQGIRIFEVDFLWTADNELVCCHDFDTIMQEGAGKANKPTLYEFISRPIYGGYTSLSVEELLILMGEYKDIYIVTDTKEELFSVIGTLVKTTNDLADEGKLSGSDAEEVLNRIVVQIYEEGQEKNIREIYPFENVILTLYKRGFDKTQEAFDIIVDYCSNNDIKAITMWADWWDEAYSETKKEAGIEVYVHTVNDLERASMLLNEGVDKIYTDYLY